ncbi:putative NADH-flavin reductase [Sinobaca qinghaiensis]|uniref:Putative NADH-flavin reductase n=1 Tax=Sinobaca qinghaiensis TaxID=342944 RepID=A0A419V3U5_9BACL|nr:SDR family oxidoreductase [Sinobaca qinghaiensis]RKD73168.1 putative NADH-flavin reductase [Sinobaca qinghaiensis]
MKIALFGGTGRVGRYILDMLLEENIEVTALARSPEKLTSASPLLKVIKGDALHKEDVEQTIQGADAVISALGTDKQNTLQQSMPHIIEAMEAHNINRLLTIGTAGILDARSEPGTYRFASSESKRRSTTAAEDHAKVYEMLQTTGLVWTIICPTYLPDGEEHGKIRAEEDFLPKDGYKITTADTAAFTVHLLLHPAYERKRVGITY